MWPHGGSGFMTEGNMTWMLLGSWVGADGAKTGNGDDRRPRSGWSTER